jgi:hypothetical protein
MVLSSSKRTNSRIVIIYQVGWNLYNGFWDGCLTNGLRNWYRIIKITIKMMNKKRKKNKKWWRKLNKKSLRGMWTE